MAGESRKVELVEFEGVQYKAVLTPITKSSINTTLPKKLSKKWLLVIVAILTGVFVVGIILNLGRSNPLTNISLSDTVTEATTFDLYHPTQLPAEFTYNPDATVSEKNIVYTTFNRSDSKIILAQQNAPKQAIQYIDSEETYNVAIGKVYILKSEPGKIKAMVDTGSSLILINADNAIQLETMKEFIAYLQLQDD